MNAFSQVKTMGGQKESASEYLRKTFKITRYALSVNKVFIVLMLVVSFLAIIMSQSIWNYGNNSDGVNVAGYIAVSACMGFFMPLIMFQHMFKRGEYDFYTSMPIKKSRYFWGFAFASVIGFLMIYTAVILVMILLTGNANILLYSLSGLALFFTVFCSTLLAIMLSKSFFAFFVTFIIINGLVIETLMMLWSVLRVDFEVYYFFSRHIINLFTPLFSAQLFHPGDHNWALGFLPLIMAVIELAAAFFLHRVRSNDGRSPLAFPKTRYPIQYLIMFMAAFLGSVGFSSSYSREGTKDINGFFLNTCRSDVIFYTLIIILVTFILTNMVFENSPRGVFRKAYHMFIFTAAYAVIYFVVIGGLLYPALPDKIVPFNSNAAVIRVYGYEERSEAEYESVVNAYETARQNVFNFDNDDHDSENADFDSEHNRLAQLCDDAYEEQQKWNRESYWVENAEKEHYFRISDIDIYFITNKEYINYLSQRTVRNASEWGRLLDSYGYTGILSDYENHYPGVNEGEYDKDYYKNTKVVEITFLEAKRDITDQYVDNVMENIRSWKDGYSYGITTFTDKEEDLEKIRANAVRIGTDDDLHNRVYGLSY